MSSAEIIRPEISHYLILADQLKALYQDIDDETLQDTLEGISELPDLIKGLIRSSLDDEALIGALKSASKTCKPVCPGSRTGSSASGSSHHGR